MSSFFACYDVGVHNSDSDSDHSSSSTGETGADPAVDESGTGEVQNKAKIRAEEAEDLSKLPAFDSVFSSVDGPPSFLDPEATRPLAVNEAHTRRPAAVAAAELASTGGGADEPVPGPRSEFDVSSLAPRLSKKSGGQAERKVGVIQAKARMYSQEGQQGPQYSAAAIAMLGGNIDGHSEGEESTKRKQPSSAMGVDEFLSKSTGAQLPRKQQDRKEREKKKRQLGQSSIGSWKTEAEMVLRQQYD